MAATQTRAQSVDLAWLQQAGVVCGGGLNVEVQGELEGAVLKRLRLADVESSGVFRQSDVETLLSQFGDSSKEPVYRQYLQCVLTLMNTATAATNLPIREVQLTAPVVLEPLEAVKRGQRFLMSANDVIAVRDHSQIFTLNRVGRSSDGRAYIYFTWSNSETGTVVSDKYVHQGELIKLGESCNLTPYRIDDEAGAASFLSNC